MAGSDATSRKLVLSERQDDIVRLWLNRPERSNALVPELLEALRDGLASAAAGRPAALVISAKGRAFSTGGDIAGFLDHSESLEALKTYSERLVGLLNATILDLLAFPAPVLCAVQGAVTGGSAAFPLASDMVLMSEEAFLQPYYVEVGFAPDGGWTALLPERIGAARALEIQLRNRRLGAAELKELGVASEIVPPGKLQDALASELVRLRGKEAASVRATRDLVRDAAWREHVALRLEAEKTRFLELIARREVVDRMREFVGRK
ncbi:enoyl-CoA hydratase/isomerase family protein [Stappia sp. F7233]|uniref:Enoyl-CoA hydratase/isomerase family protein n=1 Tax=Stappia albiluteola TaxID=2758565 RepID=A0A839AAR3_9HYPH|nr:enoyl-CoA hydratase/isomerase family protein [Stappia albiluteola]MBA5776750.1 enoyl-CoA hydratase/isomerase family protein [Stappia albiluteola]